MDDTISFEDFKKIDIRIGEILSAERVEGSEKLLKLIVDFGPAPVKPELAGEWIEVQTEDKNEGRIKRQIIAGIAQFYAPEALIGKECPFAYNIAPRMLAGLESQGMILCPSDKGNPILLHPDKWIMQGSVVK